jgi:RHS repeat-associated protein
LILSPNSEDVETGLYYNRFRYYHPESGLYLSQDPIKLEGNNPNFYAYVHDSNVWIDPFGLDPLGTSGYSVYALYENGSSTPYYIGITKQDIDTRMSQHIESGRYKGTHEILKNNVAIEQARGWEQAYMEYYQTKTGIIGEEISSTNKGNKINSFDKSRTDARGKAFYTEYEKAKAQLEGNKIKCH